jgi:hypothetical protein
MKKTLLLLSLISLSIISSAQTDSTTIYIKGIENDELKTICDLTNIQAEKIYCTDTLLRGKVFNFIIKEFKKGIIISEDNLNIVAKNEQIPMVVNGKNIIYNIDYTSHTGFGNSTDSLTITFAGLLNKKKFKLYIKYPGMEIHKELKGTEDYVLKMANSCLENEIRVPVNAEYPILAYTPPFDTGTVIKSYCLLGEENVLDWYNKFKVKHYYVIYLEIR